MAFAGLGFMLQACTGLTAIKLSTTYREQLLRTRRCSLVRSLLENSMLGECPGANPISR
jgi:hypothetical protein